MKEFISVHNTTLSLSSKARKKLKGPEIRKGHWSKASKGTGIKCGLLQPLQPFQGDIVSNLELSKFERHVALAFGYDKISKRRSVRKGRLA